MLIMTLQISNFTGCLEIKTEFFKNETRFFYDIKKSLTYILNSMFGEVIILEWRQPLTNRIKKTQLLNLSPAFDVKRENLVRSKII